MAELTSDLNTISGFKIANVDTVAAFLRKVLLCMAQVFMDENSISEERYKIEV
jgi:hypothetical protein